jgi:hypothetical protein
VRHKGTWWALNAVQQLRTGGEPYDVLLHEVSTRTFFPLAAGTPPSVKSAALLAHTAPRHSTPLIHRRAPPPQAPWLELKDYPKQPTAELAARRAGTLRALHSVQPATARPFRLLTTHLAPATHPTDGAQASPGHAGRLARLPLREQVRYVVSVSDGETAARGAFAFANGHSRRWAKAWGGFPRRHDNLTLFLEVRADGCMRDVTEVRGAA